MTAITALMVKSLREKSGAGMMDCKKALTENNGDMEQAVDWLRTKGLAAVQKKSGRVAAEGLVAIHKAGKKAAIIEVNSETDFVARNADFQAFVSELAELVLETGDDIAVLQARPYRDKDRSVADQMVENIATIGENMSIRRAANLSVNKGVVATYIHSALKDGMGKIGVLVALESDGDPQKLQELGKQLAMHIAAAKPEFLDRASVDPQAVERERAVLSEQARESGKPEEIISKMVEGRLRKYYEETVLMEQIWVMDNESKIAKVVESTAKDIGVSINLNGFVRFHLGEGIEVEEEDFAAEVAKVTKR